MATNAACECGAENQIADHKTGSFTLHPSVQMDWHDRMKIQPAGCKKPAWTFDEKLKRPDERIVFTLFFTLRENDP